MGKGNKITASTAPPKTNCADKSKNKQIYKPRIGNLGGHIRMRVFNCLQPAGTSSPSPASLLTPISSPSIPGTQVLKQVSNASLSLHLSATSSAQATLPWATKVVSMGLLHASFPHPAAKVTFITDIDSHYCSAYFSSYQLHLECVPESKNTCYPIPCCLSSPSFAHLPSLTAPPATVSSVSFSKVRTLGGKKNNTKTVNERKS